MKYNWGAIPAELRALPQWVLASGMDVAPYYINKQGGCQIASVTDPTTWMTFESAVFHATAYDMCIGFVITHDDPYACIDVDNKLANPAHPDALAWYWEQATALGAYTEQSPSGRGLHTWIQAEDVVKRRHPFEIYSHSRYIRMTGHVVIPGPIPVAQEFADWFVDRLGGRDHTVEADPLVEVEPTATDEDVLATAQGATNAGKFNALWLGDWQSGGYKSQSEADMALLTMLRFYSKSWEQGRRLFLQSGLGARKKASRRNYLTDTQKVIRSREPDDIPTISVAQLLAPYEPKPLTELPSPPVELPTTAPILEQVEVAEVDGSIPWPPGMAGQLAAFIYHSAPRPVKEVAIVGALGLLAGICGKAWHIPGSGLNMYITLVAQSAIGKEAMHSGISRLVEAASRRTPAIHQFVNHSEFASGQALIKCFEASPSFVMVSSEWGQKLKRLSDTRTHDSGMASLRTALLTLYNKSDPTAIAGGIQYSDTDKSVGDIKGVSFSLIGETTPHTFYQSLTDSMMEDGFLSRFLIIEYPGERPERNRTPTHKPNDNLTDYLAQMAHYADSSISKQVSTTVGTQPEVLQLIDEFELECDKSIRAAGTDQSRRQMWNRSALKAYRLAGALAVGDNYLHPTINVEHYTWATTTVRHGISVMSRKLDEGDVGVDDNSREKKMTKIFRDFISKGPSKGKGYGLNGTMEAAMQSAGIIPHSYVSIRCTQINAFNSHALGNKAAMRETIKAMIEAGYIENAAVYKKQIKFPGTAYKILELPS